jgi:hypothetical protein
MKRSFWCVVLLSLGSLSGGSAGIGAAAIDFNGTWAMDPAQSTQASGAQPKSEVVNITLKNDDVHMITEVVNADGSTQKLDYGGKFNDGQWHPMTDRLTGRAIGEVTFVKVDERTHYRFIRRNGLSTGVLQRRMADDGRSFVSTQLNVDGKVALARVFVKH